MMTKTKHLVSTTMHKMVCKTNCMVQTNWFKWGLLGVIVWLLVFKNVSFQLSIGEQPTNTIEKYQNDTRPKPVKTTMALDSEVPKISKKPAGPPGKSKTKKEDNRANDFSNIAFVMNPTYAKRHNISPKIVAK